VTELRAERFVAGGEALAHHPDGRAVFVRDALPGETVMVEFVTDKRDWARARTLDVVTSSADRVVPPCVHRLDGCGGCDWMHLDATAQLPAKVTVVEDALRRTAKIEAPPVHGGRSVAPFAYRTTIRVAAAANGRLGFRSGGTHDIVPTPTCLVAHPRLAAVIAGLEADPGVEATLRVSSATEQLTAIWNHRIGAIRGLPADAGRGVDAWLDERVHGRMLRVSAGSFFQSGPEAAELLVDAVAALTPELTSAEHVVDAYAGVGLFAVCNTAPGTRITAIESSRRAAKDARHNLEGREADVLTAELADVTMPSRPDVVIADPARTGLGKPGVGAIARMKSPLVTLVSCDPVALARDAVLLGRDGYELERVVVLDLFPQTHHVETVSRFVRR
jgi:23S rRNA (uracil1939-C5)-methyltransferase